MDSDRRRSKAIGTDLGSATYDAQPSIAALFLIRFDIKAGYTIAWKRSIPDVELENVVEFKSLPSGLHNVTDDLVYFVHEQYAGISAFVNRPAEESERNALMLAVGALVPLSYGRLGKIWRHAARLQELAEKVAENPEDTSSLSLYWDSHQLSSNEVPSPPDSPLDSLSSLKTRQTAIRDGFQRNRALSDATALMTSKQVLAPYHPALSLPTFLDAFGPLVFPLYRAALLRKRVLFIGDAPVQPACDFVYCLSLLSSLPRSLLPLLPPSVLVALRPRPLFSVGVHDLPYLASLPPPTISDVDTCWIACTTDRVFSMKDKLYDILVSLPPPYAKDAPKKIYPKITLSSPPPTKRKRSKPVSLKATQRDSRRYSALKDKLHELNRQARPSSADENVEEEDQSDNSSAISSRSVVEPVSWPLLAYTSFIWWASAGEKQGGPSEDETEQDCRLLESDLDSSFNPTYSDQAAQRGSITLQDQSHQPLEIALITYFRRLTTQIFTVLSNIIARHDAGDVADNADDDDTDTDTASQGSQSDHGSDEDTAFQASDQNEPLLPRPSSSPADHDEIISITSSDMADMGLDEWSGTDRAFVEEMVRVWWGRKAEVKGTQIRCCGVRIL
ncbi:hypothetical protein AJ80_00109 [Polytolypa hystricis UAMH7299]|uniref:UDENN domain-containing protein n=1 Tax=Polytolypa hystricis (strain UAMH7299) TaxID=1447883 RepID=A0A2B7Z4P2_POLH7|nr:hypothetical protein AJ80_00109 [Polytolypa hystricis UAMH7299]